MMPITPGHVYHDKVLQRANDRMASIAFRKKILEAQVMANYKNEYSRLRGHLYANPALPRPTKDLLRQRLSNLQELGKHSFDDTPDSNWQDQKN